MNLRWARFRCSAWLCVVTTCIGVSVVFLFAVRPWIENRLLSRIANPIAAEAGSPRVAAGRLILAGEGNERGIEMNLSPSKNLAIRLTDSMKNAHPRKFVAREQVIGWFTLTFTSGNVYDIQLHDHGMLYINNEAYYVPEAEFVSLIRDLATLAQGAGS